MPRPAAAILVAFDRSAPPPPAAPSPAAAAVAIEPIVLPVVPVPPPRSAPDNRSESPSAAADAGNDIKSLQERLTEAFERGRQDASLAAQAEEEGRAKAAAIWAEADRAETRRMWTETEGERLAAMISSAFETLEHSVAAAAAAVLEPFVDNAVRDRVAADFAEQLRRASDYGAMAIALGGPADLLDRIRAALGPLADRVAFDPCERIEARAVVGRTAIETRLAEWLRPDGMTVADGSEPAHAAAG